jgi:hypothetical protein
MEDILLNFDEKTVNNEKEKKYLLQIHRIKLIDYINCGLVLPDVYLGEETEKDVQSKNKNFLILSDGYIKELDEYQILLELILTDDEKVKLYNVNDIHYFDKPLPITRIKKIYVQDKNIIKHMTVQIQNSENGFLPNELFDVYIKNKKSIFEKKMYFELQDDISINNYEDKKRYFDKRMGMFSFMKNTELYYCDSTNQISNYSEHYFGILSDSLEVSLENKHFEKLNILDKNKEFKNILYSNQQIDKEFIESMANNIEDTETKDAFLQILKPTGSREVLSELLERNDIEHYLIGLVYYFRQKSANKKDNIKTDIENLIPYKVAEISLAVLGIYFGYRNLRSQEKVEIKNRYFGKIFGNTFNMKFTLESKLDYIAIESIYNICFNSKEQKGYEYKYLPYPTKNPQPLKIVTDNDFKIWYKIEKKNYFDVEQITIKKLSTLEMFGNLLGKYSEEITENKQTSYLITFVQYNFGDILIFNNKGQKYFTKDNLLKKLELLEDEKIQNELQDVLNIGKN